MKTVVAILVSIFFICSLRADVSSYTGGHTITIYPEEYPLAIRNPQKDIASITISTKIIHM